MRQVQKGDPKAETETPDQVLGRSQGGFGTKVHVRVEGGGKPITFLLTAGQRHEAPPFEALLEQGALKRAGRGRPRRKPKRVMEDKGYTAGRTGDTAGAGGYGIRSLGGATRSTADASLGRRTSGATSWSAASTD
jgi:hypothetical protein